MLRKQNHVRKVNGFQLSDSNLSEEDKEKSALHPKIYNMS